MASSPWPASPPSPPAWAPGSSAAPPPSTSASAASFFGLLGFLLSRGIFEKKLLSILGSILGVLAFGGALRGLFPGTAGISWEGHLFGFLGGILAARLAVSPSAAAPRIAAPPTARARIAPAPGRGIEAEAEAEAEADDALETLKRRMGR